MKKRGPAGDPGGTVAVVGLAVGAVLESFMSTVRNSPSRFLRSAMIFSISWNSSYEHG
jgi:hypothetical protein